MIPPPFAEGMIFAIVTDTDSKYVAPTVTEGTFAPATATIEVSEALNPYVIIDVQNTPIDITISYSANMPAD